MNKIKLYLIAATLGALLQPHASLADELPHIVATLECPAGEVCCPEKIYCSYKEGCGNISTWLHDESPAPFDGVQQFDLFKINASLLWWEKHKSKSKRLINPT